MATKGILRTVKFKDKKLCRGFVIALENAQGRKGKDVVVSRTYETVGKDKINSFFESAALGENK